MLAERPTPPPFREQLKDSSEDILQESFLLLGVKYNYKGIDISSLPFSAGDTTGGSELELQATVFGRKEDVDLPAFIEQSNYYANIQKREKSGDIEKGLLSKLKTFLDENKEAYWDNSWVRISLKTLSKKALKTLRYDLLADKTDSKSDFRTDMDRFFINSGDEELLRIPISYLLKLAAADIVANLNISENLAQRIRLLLLDKFSNDNTSPEISSFYIANSKTNLGSELSGEMALRYLLIQLIVGYSNKKFNLVDSGQKVIVYFSPHPSLMQKTISECVSDCFYRELFMNPCLSGWNRGEDKYRYMHLCHMVLSRSQLNAILKLREAGIITNNLVVLPNLSNISLTNNGIHISLGSKKLTDALSDSQSGFSSVHEKYLGDLAIKVAEHFLPLFVGNYTSAVYRLSFTDFHPEKVLGYLPHELDFTHLRMLWRRWKKKAKISIFGNPVTPFGPTFIDNFISFVFSLKGDYVIDYRLINYLVALLSTEKNSALNGVKGNSVSLKKDLEQMGVFDTQMSLYLLEKLREFEVMGFSGFESRHYSLFYSFTDDMKNAILLQNLIYALAYKYILTGQVSHRDIPDSPFVESERRQVIFFSAIDLPTFFVHKDTQNRFIKRVLAKTEKTRVSNRYPNYIRVYINEYKRALFKVLKEDGADLIEMFGMVDTIKNLEDRLKYPEKTSAGKVLKDIKRAHRIKSPLDLNADDFNKKLENYYRFELRQKHIDEALKILDSEFEHLITQDKELVNNFVSSGELEQVKNLISSISGKDITDDSLSLDEQVKIIKILFSVLCHKEKFNR